VQILQVHIGRGGVSIELVLPGEYCSVYAGKGHDLFDWKSNHVFVRAELYPHFSEARLCVVLLQKKAACAFVFHGACERGSLRRSGIVCAGVCRRRMARSCFSIGRVTAVVRFDEETQARLECACLIRFENKAVAGRVVEAHVAHLWVLLALQPLAEIEKLSYLLYFLEGEALEAVGGFAAAPENHEAVQYGLRPERNHK
uniref:Uncharacterized protein n=1 Tax=Parascaris equorum TaxID=6256 RepID=A0A914RMG3_PAREQ